MGDLPRCDVVILPMHTPDEPLDGVSVVVQDENDWGQLIGDHRRQLLNGELTERPSQYAMRPIHQSTNSQTTISNEKDGPSQVAIPSTTRGTQKSTDAITNTPPQDLGNKRGFLGQRHVDDTEARGSGLGEDDILGLEKLSNARPQPRLRNDVVGLVGNGVEERGDGDLQSGFSESRKFGRQLGKEPLEADSGVEGMQDAGVVRVKLI